MKKILSLVFLLTLGVAASAQGWFRQPTPNDTLKSTRVLPAARSCSRFMPPRPPRLP